MITVWQEQLGLVPRDRAKPSFEDVHRGVGVKRETHDVGASRLRRSGMLAPNSNRQNRHLVQKIEKGRRWANSGLLSTGTRFESTKNWAPDVDPGSAQVAGEFAGIWAGRADLAIASRASTNEPWQNTMLESVKAIYKPRLPTQNNRFLPKLVFWPMDLVLVFALLVTL